MQTVLMAAEFRKRLGDSAAMNGLRMVSKVVGYRPEVPSIWRHFHKIENNGRWVVLVEGTRLLPTEQLGEGAEEMVPPLKTRGSDLGVGPNDEIRVL